MGVSLIFKIAAVGILVTILSQILKHSGREEHAFLLSLAGLILVLTWVIPYIYDLFTTIQNPLLGITGVLIGLQFKSGKQEYSAYIGIAVALIIFYYICQYLTQVKDSVLALGGFLEGSGTYFGILFKVTGITYLCQFCAGLCRDAGYQAIAAQVELFGKVTILLAGMPVLLSLIDTITGFMK